MSKSIASLALLAFLVTASVTTAPAGAQEDGAVVSDQTIVIWVRDTTQKRLRGQSANYFDGCIGAPPGTSDEMARWVDDNLGTVSPFFTNHAHVVFPRGDFTFGAIACPDDLGKLGGDGWAWWTIGGGTPGTPDVFAPLSNQAMSQLAFPPISLESSPDGILTPLLAQLPVGFWPSDWPTVNPETAAIPGYALTVTSTLQQETVVEVDGVEVARCIGEPPDLSATPDWTSTPCSYTFEDPTDPGESYRLGYEMRFQNVATCTDAAGPTPCNAGSLPDIVLRTDRNVTVAEALGLVGAGL